MKPLLFAVMLLPVSACMVAETPEAKEQRLASYGAQCQADYGFKRGSEYYAQCVMTLDQAARAESREKQAAFGQAMQNMGNSMQNSAPTRCHSTGYGNSVSTTCY